MSLSAMNRQVHHLLQPRRALPPGALLSPPPRSGRGSIAWVPRREQPMQHREVGPTEPFQRLELAGHFGLVMNDASPLFGSSSMAIRSTEDIFGVLG